MGLFSAFDAGFDGADVSASISRKAEDGTTRGGRLTGAVPTGMTLEEFAEAARYGLSRTMKGKDRGVTLSKRAPELKGDKAEAAVLSLGDPVPAPAKPDPVPEATRRRGRSVLAATAPSLNNGPPADGAVKS